jgi:hypothetical protein
VLGGRVGRTRTGHSLSRSGENGDLVGQPGDLDRPQRDPVARHQAQLVACLDGGAVSQGQRSQPARGQELDRREIDDDELAPGDLDRERSLSSSAVSRSISPATATMTPASIGTTSIAIGEDVTRRSEPACAPQDPSSAPHPFMRSQWMVEAPRSSCRTRRRRSPGCEQARDDLG